MFKRRSFGECKFHDDLFPNLCPEYVVFSKRISLNKLLLPLILLDKSLQKSNMVFGKFAYGSDSLKYGFWANSVMVPNLSNIVFGQIWQFRKLKPFSILKEKSFKKFPAFKFIREIPLKFEIKITLNFIREILEKIVYLLFYWKNPYI